MNEQTEIRIGELVYKSLEGIITERECRELEKVLASDPDALKYYVSSIELNNRILKIKDSISKPLQMMMAFEEMAEHEKTAPAIEIAEKEPRQELLQKVVYPPRVKRKLSKFSIFMLVNGAAAILFFVLFLKFVPPKVRVEVATLTDSVNAKWADVDASMQEGTRFTTGDMNWLLREGFAELVFDNTTKVTLEAPAEFQILADDQMILSYGRLYATVPTEAIGFTVSTRTARIIDLGTEFGVEADPHGNTDLHVIKGRTTLIAGLREGNKQAHDVLAGAAMRVKPDSEIRNIEHKENLFVRSINSRTNFIWRGRNLSLASITAGYDGFKEVDSLIGLDPVKGELVTSVTHEWRRTNKAYNLIPELKFIDGVFVPDGESGPVRITSSGHTFDCPDTSGIFTHAIAAYKGPVEKQNTTIPPVIIKGQEIINDPILMIHSNSGITFDLKAIRESLPQLDLKGLKAIGIPITESNIADFDFWILIDGRIKYERKIVTVDSKDPISINVEFTPEDRFLTLIVTDGLRAVDDERENENVFAQDFFYLINPELCLTDGLRR